ncbi:TIGR02444 family protein [uncultured Legionella sp.]|uniref:TIGR02444 family protein n=1 Tax=uncultured Legionella sp. TaxID=210934 RepID=UPI00262FBB0B|nr:TIGR02444 family protein [uncultured Legionella sp.]
MQLYAHEEVKQLCITLQDCYEINVNIILWCCWFASVQGECSKELLSSILADNKPWHAQVTCQLRQARQWLRNNHQHELVQPFRQQLLQLEITSEAFEQEQLYQRSMKQNQSGSTGRSAARSNMQMYFNQLHATVSEAHWQFIELNLLTRVNEF